MQRENCLRIAGRPETCKAFKRPRDFSTELMKVKWRHLGDQVIEFELQWIDENTVAAMNGYLLDAPDSAKVSIIVEYTNEDSPAERDLKRTAMNAWSNDLRAFRTSRLVVLVEMRERNLELFDYSLLDPTIVQLELQWSPTPDTDDQEWVRVIRKLRHFKKAKFIFGDDFTSNPPLPDPPSSLEPPIDELTLELTVTRGISNRRSEVYALLMRMMSLFKYEQLKMVVLRTDGRLRDTKALDEGMDLRWFYEAEEKEEKNKKGVTFVYVWELSPESQLYAYLMSLHVMALSSKTGIDRPVKRFLARDGDHAIGRRILRYLGVPATTIDR